MKNFRMQDEKIAKAREDQAAADKELNQALIGSGMTSIAAIKPNEIMPS